MFVIKNGLGVKQGFMITVMSLLILHLFGVFGNIREGSLAIKQLGKPTVEFQNSAVPMTYFWVYIYMSSPIANLQLTVDSERSEDRGAAEFVVTEILPDFISKHILPTMGTERVKPEEVSKGLSVSTIFGRAYVIAGWFGAVLMFALLSFLIVVYLRLIVCSPYAVPCLALLSTLVVFSTFQNMIAYTGMILQLFWPLFLRLTRFLGRRRTWRVSRNVM